MAKEYDIWLNECNKSEIIKKNELIVGNAYLLETGVEVVFLGTYFCGSFDVLYSNDGRNYNGVLKYSNSYKKDSISGTEFHSKDFISNNKDKFVKNIDLKFSSRYRIFTYCMEIKEFILLFFKRQR